MSPGDNSGYESFDRLITRLKAEGYPADAHRLHVVLHETAWTISSELLGELGREIVAIQHSGPACSTELYRELDDCLGIIRRAWPTIGQSTA